MQRPGGESELSWAERPGPATVGPVGDSKAYSEPPRPPLGFEGLGWSMYGVAFHSSLIWMEMWVFQDAPGNLTSRPKELQVALPVGLHAPPHPMPL